MTHEQIEALAGYLTDTQRVTYHSVALETSGRAKLEGRAFFALREALGIRGYATKEQAIAIIGGKLCPAREKKLE